MANGRFVNDYSFLNLPEPGSAVRSPIDIAQASLPPSVLEQINFSAPRELPQADLLTRGPTPQIIPTRPQGILGTQNFQNILETAVGNAEAEIQMLQEAKIDLTNQYEQAVVERYRNRSTGEYRRTHPRKRRCYCRTRRHPSNRSR